MFVKLSFHCRFWLSRKNNTHKYWKCLTPFSVNSLGQSGWRSSTDGLASVLNPMAVLFGSTEGQHQPPCFLSFRNSRKLEWKMCIILCPAVSHGAAHNPTLRPDCCSGCDYVGLEPAHHSVFFLFFFVYALVLVFLEILKNVCVLCKERQPCRVFPLTQVSSVSDDRFTSGMCLCVHICTAAAEETIRTAWSAWRYLRQLFILTGLTALSSLVQCCNAVKRQSHRSFSPFLWPFFCHACLWLRMTMSRWGCLSYLKF